jgi:hypothetical protein
VAVERDVEDVDESDLHRERAVVRVSSFVLGIQGVPGFRVAEFLAVRSSREHLESKQVAVNAHSGRGELHVLAVLGDRGTEQRRRAVCGSVGQGERDVEDVDESDLHRERAVVRVSSFVLGVGVCAPSGGAKSVVFP